MNRAMPDPFAGGFAPVFELAAWWGGLGALGVALLLGWALLPRLGRWSRSEAWLLRAVVGLVPANLAVLLAGQIPRLLWRLPWSLLGVAGWLVLTISFWRRPRWNVAGSGSDRRLDRLGGLLVAVWLAAALVPAFCPPLSYDVLEYHLGYVTHIFATGQVRPIPHVFYTAQPLATEMLFTLAALIEHSPWGFGPGVALWLLVALGAMLFFRLAAALAIPRPWRPLLLLMLLAHPLIFRLYLDRFTDWMGLLFLAAGLWMWRRSKLEPRRIPFLMGLMAGGAVSAKWTNVGTVAVPIFIFVLLGPSGWREGPPPPGQRRARWRGVVLCLAGAVVAWGPWALWLWLVRGNPFAPFLAGLFPTDGWTADQLAFLLQTHGPLSPLSVIYWTNLLQRVAVDLPSPPLAALALGGYGCRLVLRALGMCRRRGSAAHPLAWSILISLLLWGRLRHGADRFLAPTMLLSVLLLGDLLRQLFAGIERRWSRPARQGACESVVLLLFLLGALPGAIQFSRIMSSGLFVSGALGRLSRVDYWRQVIGSTADLFEAAHRTEEDVHLLAINEARRYPFGRRVDLASVFDINPVREAIRGSANADAIQRKLIQAGYTHLLYNGFEQNRILAMHTPPALQGDPGLAALLRSNDQAGLARGYWGYTEFATDPLTEPERTIYGDFLNSMRRRAMWVEQARPGAPAMWIAPLRNSVTH